MGKHVSPDNVDVTQPVELNYSQVDQADIERTSDKSFDLIRRGGGGDEEEEEDDDGDEEVASSVPESVSYKANLLNRSFNRRFRSDGYSSPRKVSRSLL